MKLNILLVEDESTIRSGFRKVLEDVIGGVHVAGEASNGREALEWLKSHTTDAVFTDIRMKEMNGIDLIKRLKEQSPALPVVIISGYNDFVYAREAIRYEAVDYLLKPVETAELAQVVERLKKRTLKGKPDNGPPKEAEERQVIRRVKELIGNRLEQDISLQDLADQVHLNHRYLSVLFKSETGQNLSDYVTQVRMERAKQLLKDTQMKIQDIAKLSGYPNVKYFMHLFKQNIGCTPSEYRENNNTI
ncbi:response regulator transcription factor [Paenibacillus silviterrae]|uniref:response regulator transcription factor n=1 Tax=Paenibacillus silviterrae TaxID=3242194 RepID=UPI002543026B|nr:response regulator [Paenibacillus chinjuensis]